MVHKTHTSLSLVWRFSVRCPSGLWREPGNCPSGFCHLSGVSLSGVRQISGASLSNFQVWQSYARHEPAFSPA